MIKIAYLSYGKAHEGYFLNQLRVLGMNNNIRIVFSGNDPASRTRELRNARPDVVLIRSGDPGFDGIVMQKGLETLFNRLHKHGFEPKFLLQVDRKDTGLLKRAKELGISVIDSASDANMVCSAIEGVYRGEVKESLLPDTRELDTFHGRMRRI